tara:strand:- start:1709 stop:2212 length:504 start_codon:yes stop_codon:yes gene_type:complete
MKKRRCTLILILSLSALYRKEVRNYTFIPLLFFFNALIVFGNFPFLILISNKRPMFVDDLFIKDRNEIEFNLTDIEKEKFEKRFSYMLILSNSLFVAALADYFYYEIINIRDESYVGMLGITGGIIKMFQIVNHGSGVILLLYTRGKLLKNVLHSKSEGDEQVEYTV